MNSTALSSPSTISTSLDALEVDLAQIAILPAQWEWGQGSLAAVSAEARLMLAVLEDAIRSAKRLSTSSAPAPGNPRETQEKRELREWFASTDRSYTFSFENICATLDIDPAHVRSAIRDHALPGARSPRRRGRAPAARAGGRLRARVAMTAVAVLASLATLTSGGSALASEKPATKSDARRAHADLVSRDGRDVGHVRMTETAQGIILRVRTSLLPQGTRGFHVHSVGRCDPETGFQSAGGHFDPNGASHGFAAGADRHAGDLPNLEISEESKLEVTFFLPDVTLDDGTRGLLDADGSALVIHRNPDDYETDPGGNSGDRLACGVVEPGAEVGADPAG